MQSFAMDHQRAADSQACVRYLMQEMDPAECSSFEDHYLTCQECSDEVKFGFDAVEALRQVIKEEPAPAPGFLERLMSALRQPALGFGLATLIVAGVAINRQVAFHNITQATVVRTPTLRPAAKGSDQNIVTMPSKGIFTVNFLVDANPSEYVSYEAILAPDPQDRGEGNSFQKSFPISDAEAVNTVGIRLYSGDVAPGNYALTTFGIKKDGSRRLLSTFYLRLQSGN
jgi:hypothetical protein